jgi:hypothetical protein
LNFGLGQSIAERGSSCKDTFELERNPNVHSLDHLVPAVCILDAADVALEAPVPVLQK